MHGQEATEAARNPAETFTDSLTDASNAPEPPWGLPQITIHQGLLAYATEAQSRHHCQHVIRTGAAIPSDIRPCPVSRRHPYHIPTVPGAIEKSRPVDSLVHRTLRCAISTASQSVKFLL